MRIIKWDNNGMAYTHITRTLTRYVLRDCMLHLANNSKGILCKVLNADDISLHLGLFSAVELWVNGEGAGYLSGDSNVATHLFKPNMREKRVEWEIDGYVVD